MGLRRRETADYDGGRGGGRPPSQAITVFAYDPAAQQLYVRFPEGRTYAYFPLPAQDYDRFVAAPSRGTYLNTVIKPICRYQQVPRIPPLLKTHRG